MLVIPPNFPDAKVDTPVRHVRQYVKRMLQSLTCAAKVALTPKDYEEPYAHGGLLKTQGRDIVFNCEYGQGDVWFWIDRAGGNSWRMTDDLGLEERTSLPGFYR